VLNASRILQVGLLALQNDNVEEVNFQAKSDTSWSQLLSFVQRHVTTSTATSIDVKLIGVPSLLSDTKQSFMVNTFRHLCVVLLPWVALKTMN
jgi:hypothetical protein